MRKISCFLFFIVGVMGCSLSAPASQTDNDLSVVVSNNNEFSALMEKIRGGFKQNPSVAKIDEALAKYKDADGSFTDIDYADTQRTNWKPLKHIDRLSNFAFAYTNPANKYYGDEAMYEKIEKGLEYWYARDPQCSNWWYNQIAEPQALGVMLIQLRIGKRRLPAELEQKTLERMKKDGGDPAKWTGANRTDIALHWIYRACLTEDEAVLTTALDNVYNPIVYTTREGFQYDNCYFQHGQQLYIGGYGDEILKGVTQVAMYTRGTRYAISAEKLELLSRFMRETYYRTIRGSYMLFDVLGRGVSRPGVTKKKHTALYARRMMELDVAHADEYRAIIDRLEGKAPADYALTPVHTHYFRGDYTLHVRPSYTFDVRLVSSRTLRCEYGNGENLKTYFMSDGCTNIVTRGDEYADIFPVWNWARIPGTTAPQLADIPMAKIDWQTPGTSTFAGGVSDGIYGATAYLYEDNYAGINTSARKAWFFFDDEVVCLGAGICSSSPAEVRTTVNQCLANGAVVRSKKSPQWVLHDGVGYLFPQGGNLFVTRQEQSGSWYDINHSTSRDVQKKDVFCLGIDHGKQPVDDTYAYIVLPGKQSKAEMQAYAKRNDVEILSNGKNLQVAHHKGLDVWQMVFYTAGEYNGRDVSVKVDKPCALMIRGNKIHVADPGQTQSVINVSLLTPTLKEEKNISFDFIGSGIYAGASMERLF